MKLTCIPGSQLPVFLPRRAKPTPQRRQTQVHTRVKSKVESHLLLRMQTPTFLKRRAQEKWRAVILQLISAGLSLSLVPQSL